LQCIDLPLKFALAALLLFIGKDRVLPPKLDPQGSDPKWLYGDHKWRKTDQSKEHATLFVHSGLFIDYERDQ
jgi:hypothetical protein